MDPDIRINVTQQDLAYYNLTSIPLADGSGFAAELGVHHELHCLVSRRQTRALTIRRNADDVMCAEKDPSLDSPGSLSEGRDGGGVDGMGGACW